MQGSVILEEGLDEARVSVPGFEGLLPVFVARGEAATLTEEGVLLREGSDVVLVRVGGQIVEALLHKRKADGSLVRVRVARIDERHR